MFRILKIFFSRIGLWSVIKNHYKTFYNASDASEKISGWEIALQTFLFILLSTLLAVFVYTFSKDVLNAILTTETILTAFLFASLFTIADKRSSYSPAQQEYKIARDTVNNIAFCILLSVITIILIVVYIAIKEKINLDAICISFSIPIYVCIFEQVYVLLMVIRRVNKLFS